MRTGSDLKELGFSVHIVVLGYLRFGRLKRIKKLLAHRSVAENG